MRPISIDLRVRIVAAVEGGEHSLRELAELFTVDVSTIVRLLQRFRSTGSVQPKKHGGGARPKLDAEAVARLLELVRQQPDATLAELCSRLGVACSIMTIFRVLQPPHHAQKDPTCPGARYAPCPKAAACLSREDGDGGSGTPGFR
ncbi:MAG: transposase [Gemmataceae bacterium]